VTAVLDANLVVVLANPPDPRHGAVLSRVATWDREGADLHAPTLLPYEFASALTRLAAVVPLATDLLATAWEVLEDLDLTLHPLDDGVRVVTLARRLGRRSAYDAAYIALAERLGAELWTLDGKLAANAESVGFPVRLVSTPR